MLFLDCLFFLVFNLLTVLFSYTMAGFLILSTVLMVHHVFITFYFVSHFL